MATKVRHAAEIPQPPLNRYSPLDDNPLQAVRLSTASAATMRKLLGISESLAGRIVRARRGRSLRGPADLHAALEGTDRADFERIRRRCLLEDDSFAIITDLLPARGRIMSDRPFALRLHFAFVPDAPPVLARIAVEWAGDRFFVEQLVTRDNLEAGFVDVRFGPEQTLPTGGAVFRATLSTVMGGQGEFRVTCVVLPSNPFSLSLAPTVNFVTGTFSARAVRGGNGFDTHIALTLSNGNSAPVTLPGQFTWKFWDGGVGGSLIEQGTGSFGPTVTVPPFGTFGGSIGFHSPPGSGVFDKFDNREDLTIEILMQRPQGERVSGSITARTMFRFGVNVTQVAFEDFDGREDADLGAAVAITRTIYERHDVTFVTDDRGIAQARAGGFESIDSDSEARDLWEQWSGPDTNNNIDAFVVNQLLIDGRYDGMDGDIPGPTSHHGRSSGTVQNKSGFVDASGVRRLHIPYLGMLVAHELGHYLGLSHVGDAGNLMLSNSGETDTNLSYDQYRTIIRHGWVAID